MAKYRGSTGKSIKKIAARAARRTYVKKSRSRRGFEHVIGKAVRNEEQRHGKIVWKFTRLGGKGMAKRAMTEEAKEIKANQILDQAANWLMQMDYEKIKMLDLAKSMNISNGILYVYFRTKETLFLCLLWREYNKRLSYLEAKTEESNIVCFADIKQLLLDELEYLIDCNPIIISSWNVCGHVILERNTDDGILFRMKKQLSERMDAGRTAQPIRRHFQATIGGNLPNWNPQF